MIDLVCTYIWVILAVDLVCTYIWVIFAVDSWFHFDTHHAGREAQCGHL